MGKFKNSLKSLVGSRHALGGALTAAIIAVVVVFNGVIYALTSLLGIYTDPTSEYDLSISGNTDHLFEEAELLDREVKIIFCTPEDDLLVHETGKFVQATARELEKRYGFIKIEYYNVISEADKLIKYKGDGKLLSSSVIFDCEGNYKVITDLYSSAGFADFFALNASSVPIAYIGEEVMCSMVSWVLTKEHKKVYFTENHGETADVALSTLLNCAGYVIDPENYTVNLTKNPVPEDCELLIISSPVTDIEKPADGSSVITEKNRLEAYLEKGGNLFVTIDPYGKRLPVLEEILRSYGIELTYGLNEDGKEVRAIVSESRDAVYADGLTFLAGYAEGELSEAIAKDMEKYGSGKALISQSGALKLSGEAKPLLKSSAGSSLYLGGSISDREGEYTVAAYSETHSDDGRKGKILLLPGVYFTASNVLVNPGAANKDYTYALLSRLYGAPTAPYGTSSIVFTTGALDGFTMGRARLYTAIIMAIPVALAVVGTVIIIKRKNR